MIDQGGTSGPDGPLEPGETPDAALGGAVRLIQPRRGYRFALDSVLLARFASEHPGRRAMDLGCGCGAVSLCLIALGGAREVVGIDVQDAMVDRALRSARWNRWQEKASFRVADLRTVREHFTPQSFDRVVSNPPYRPLGAGRVSPDASAALSRHEVSCSFPDVAGAAAYLLGPGGEFCAVYPATRLTSLLGGCREAGLEPKALWPVHPGPGEAASLALVRCTRGGGEGLEVRSPLFLHAPGARYSAEAERLLGPP
ncbi:MAG: methyltransferase domain-containing protein [Deferrisomatales bacterium]|nr:methyltransferase domain-containing protein [Deferrisomatales bacterium]